MTPKNKKIIITVALFVALITSNVIGGIIGFNKGFEARLHQEGLEAVSNVALLNALRKGKVDSAIHLLETKLDWQIYNIDEYEQAHYSLYNLDKYSKDFVDIKKLQKSIMEKVVAYRNDHPCESKYDFEKDWCNPDNDFRKKINNTLKKYQIQENSI